MPRPGLFEFRLHLVAAGLDLVDLGLGAVGDAQGDDLGLGGFSRLPVEQLGRKGHDLRDRPLQDQLCLWLLGVVGDNGDGLLLKAHPLAEGEGGGHFALVAGSVGFLVYFQLYTCAVAAALVGEYFDGMVAGVGKLVDDYRLGVRRAGVEFLFWFVPM